MDKTPCQHLNNLLPGLRNGLVSQDALQNFGNYSSDLASVEEYEARCQLIETSLMEAGLNPTETFLIMDRLVSGLTISELAKKYGTTSSIIITRLKEIVLELKENTSLLSILQVGSDNGIE